MCSAMFALCAAIECTLAKCAALSVGSVTLLPAVGQLLLARPQLKAELARPQLPHPRSNLPGHCFRGIFTAPPREGGLYMSR